MTEGPERSADVDVIWSASWHGMVADPTHQGQHELLFSSLWPASQTLVVSPRYTAGDYGDSQDVRIFKTRGMPSSQSLYHHQSKSHTFSTKYNIQPPIKSNLIITQFN